MQLTGNIEDLGMGEIFQILNFSGKSGVLRLHNSKMEGSIVFKDGLVTKANCSLLKEGVGEMLLRENAIAREELDAAKEVQKKGAYAETLGEVLVRGRKVAREKIDAVAATLIEKAVYPFFFWKDGYFVFELCDYAETPETIRTDTLQHTLATGLNPQFLAMEGMRLRDESEETADAPPAPVAEAGRHQAESAGTNEAAAAPAGALLQGGSPAGSTEDIRYYLRDLLNEIGEDGYFPKDTGEAVRCVSNSKGIMVLKEMLEELARPMSLNEIVLLILRFSSEIVSRSVLFSVRGDHLVGSGQFGIEIKGEAPDSRVRKIRIPVSEPSILSAAINKKRIVVKELEETGWDEYLVEQLGGHRPLEAFVAPIMVHGRVEMLLYGDNVPEPNRLDDISTLEIFLGQTNIAMERKY